MTEWLIGDLYVDMLSSTDWQDVDDDVGDPVMVMVVIARKITVWDQVLVMVVIAGKITVWDQVLVMVVIAGMITVWFWPRGDWDGLLLGWLDKSDMVMEIWDGDLLVLYQFHTMVSSCLIIIVVNLINLLNAMLLSCIDVYGFC